MDAKELKPCPFCGDVGKTEIVENGKIWNGTRYSEPASISVRHWCPAPDGQPNRMIERVGRDRESAVAAWNRRDALPSGAVQAPLTDEKILRLADACGLYGVRRGALAFAREVLKDAAPVATAAPQGYADGIEAVAKMLEKKADDYALEFGHDDMGALSFGQGNHAQAKLEYHSNLLELAEDVRAMRAVAPTPTVAADAAAPTPLGSPAEGHWGEPETPADGHKLESDVDEEASRDT